MKYYIILAISFLSCISHLYASHDGEEGVGSCSLAAKRQKLKKYEYIVSKTGNNNALQTQSQFKTLQFNDLFAEIILKVFSHLPLKSALDGACVCKRWHTLLNDETLWKSYASRYMTVQDKKENHVKASEKGKEEDQSSPIQALDHKNGLLVPYYKARLKPYFSPTLTIIEDNTRYGISICGMSANGSIIIGSERLNNIYIDMKRALIFQEDTGYIPFYDYLKNLDDGELIVKNIKDIESIDALNGEGTTLAGKLMDNSEATKLYIYRKGIGLEILARDQVTHAIKFTGISSDGTKIIGTETNNSFYISLPDTKMHYFNKSPEIASIFAEAISADGSTIVGTVNFHAPRERIGSTSKPFIYKSGTDVSAFTHFTTIDLPAGYCNGKAIWVDTNGNKVIVNAKKINNECTREYHFMFSMKDQELKQLFPHEERTSLINLSADGLTKIVMRHCVTGSTQHLPRHVGGYYTSRSSKSHLEYYIHRDKEKANLKHLIQKIKGAPIPFNLKAACVAANGLMVAGTMAYNKKGEEGKLDSCSATWHLSIPFKEHLKKEEFMLAEEDKIAISAIDCHELGVLSP